RALRRGACCAATRGRTEGSTRFDDSRLAPHSARARRAPRSQLAALQPASAVGVVDRRSDRDRADAARAADGQADPLDAEPAALRAADEGDPEEVQGRPAEAERRADEVLPGEPDQPGRVVP